MSGIRSDAIVPAPALAQPPGIFTATRLMARMFVRRLRNRIQATRRRPRKNPTERTGTARKSTSSGPWMVIVGVIMVFNAINMTSVTLHQLSVAVGPLRDSSGLIEVSPRLYQAMAVAGGTPTARQTHLVDVERDYWSESPRWTEAFEDQYQTKGVAGFTPANIDRGIFLPKIAAWSSPSAQGALANAFGILLLVLATARFGTTLGSGNQDLGAVEWSTEWLFTFPVTARSLFLSQILGHALVDPFNWVITLPMFFVLGWSQGLGWAALAYALLGSVYLALIMASLRVFAETWLRKQLVTSQLKNFQAIFTVVGILSLFSLFLPMRSQDAADWLASHAGFPGLSWNPFSLPVQFHSGPLAIVLAAGSAMAALAASMLGCAWLVRDGLLTNTGAYIGQRKKRSPGPRRFDLSMPPGIVGKDLRLLMRDRNFLVQALVTPVLVVGLQLFNGGLMHSIWTDFHHAAAFAFSLGAYVLISTALTVLSVEGNSLWMLYSFPQPIDQIIRRKTLLWAGCAMFYALAVLALCAWHNPAMRLTDLIPGAAACVGVLIYAYIAAALGMLSTDPLETEVRRRIKVSTIYLYMILASMFGYALYAPSEWTRLGQIVLSSLLAYALWQKVRDRSPYLLDPVSAPPACVSLADGLIAALAFFVLQGLIALVALKVKTPLGPALVIAFAGSGFLVLLGTTATFRQRNLPSEEWGFGAPSSTTRIGALGLGALAGLTSGFIGILYLAALEFIPALHAFREKNVELQAIGGWLIPLAVIAAPFCEEFIFRGLVFRGLRRSLPLATSIFASAAIFALCHPPISFLPVFIMACGAAWTLERTRWLAAPIVTHMVYNAIILLASRWLF